MDPPMVALCICYIVVIQPKYNKSTCINLKAIANEAEDWGVPKNQNYRNTKYEGCKTDVLRQRQLH